MAIRPTEIKKDYDLYDSRQILNNNFKLLADEINAVTALIDPATKQLSNIKSITLYEQAGVISSATLLDVWGATKFRGKSSFDSDVVFNKTVSFASDVAMTGSVTLSSPASTFSIAGKLHVGGEMVYKEMSDNYIEANSKLTFIQTGSNNLLTVSGTIVAGIFNPTGRSLVVFNWASWDESDTNADLDTIFLDTTGLTPGHEITIISKLGSITDHSFYIHPDNIAHQELNGTWTNGITFDGNNQVAVLIFDGAERWIVKSLTGGATLS